MKKKYNRYRVNCNGNYTNYLYLGYVIGTQNTIYIVFINEEPENTCLKYA